MMTQSMTVQEVLFNLSFRMNTRLATVTTVADYNRTLDETLAQARPEFAAAGLKPMPRTDTAATHETITIRVYLDKEEILNIPVRNPDLKAAIYAATYD